MPVNANPEYVAAEQEYLLAQTPEEKIEKLKKMISLAPKHKSSENLLANLKTRLKKLLEKQEKDKKSKKSSKKGIKKAEMQVVIIGFANSGKSSLLSLLTNARPEIAYYNFTTKEPMIGIMDYQGCQIQIIENPAINSEYYDKGITNTTDILLIIITSLEELKEIDPMIKYSQGKRIIIFNTKDETDERKLESTLKSKKYNFVIINLKTAREGDWGEDEGIEKLNQLKERMFSSFNKLRIFTKEPGKPKSEKPIILNPGSKVKDVAEKIFHGFSKQVKETLVTGPSSKFPNQKVGLQHELKDLDIVEFKTK